MNPTQPKDAEAQNDYEKVCACGHARQNHPVDAECMAMVDTFFCRCEKFVPQMDEKKEELYWHLSTNAINAGKNYRLFLEFLNKFKASGAESLKVEFVYPEILEERKRHEAILSEERARLEEAVDVLKYALDSDEFYCECCEDAYGVVAKKCARCAVMIFVAKLKSPGQRDQPTEDKSGAEE